jgi:hypothetical protein
LSKRTEVSKLARKMRKSHLPDSNDAKDKHDTLCLPLGIFFFIIYSGTLGWKGNLGIFQVARKTIKIHVSYGRRNTSCAYKRCEWNKKY